MSTQSRDRGATRGVTRDGGVCTLTAGADTILRVCGAYLVTPACLCQTNMRGDIKS